MKKWDIVRVISLMVASTLILFGGLANIARTVKLAVRKMVRK